MTQAAKKDGASRIFWGGGGVPSHPSAPSLHICSLTSNALSWERTGCLFKGAWGRGLSSPRRSGYGAGWQPGPQSSLPLLHAAREQGLLTPWEPINRKQTPTWCLLPPPGPHHHSPPTALPLAQDLPRLSPAPESQNQEVMISSERTKSS